MLANGTVLQTRYLIKRLLADGEAANIYEAEATHLDHISVRIKETFSLPQETNEEFQQKAAVLATLRHCALPEVRDYFVEGHSRFLVTEPIPGQSLDQLLKEKLKTEATPFDWRQVANWADRLLDALEYLHNWRPPILHPGIKPQNLILTPHGDLFLPGDFDVDKGAATPARPGRGFQTDIANYTPPEQLKRTGTDVRGDLYSLGATLHYLLSGEIPDSAKVREEVMRYQVPDPLPAVHELNPQVPKPLAEVILRSLALDREARYPSANAMREAWRQARQASEQPPITPEAQEAERRRQQEADRLQWEEQHRLQQEVAARQQREAEQRRQEEEKRFLAEQRRQEEEKRHREARQRELEQQRKQAEDRRRQQQRRREAEQPRLEEERIAEQKQLEQEQAEKRRQEEAPGQELARQESDRKPAARKLKNQVTTVRLPRARWVAGAVSILIVFLVIWLWPQRGTRTASQSLAQDSSLPQPSVSALPARAAPEQLQYWFEQFVNGRPHTVTTDELVSEQEFKLHFKPSEDAYLYLLALDGISGQLTAFLPGGAELSAGREFVFPNGQRIRGLGKGEQLRFTVLLSRNRIENFDALVEQAKSQPEAIKMLQTQLGAISPSSIEDVSGRGTPANVVSNQESHQPLIFDINLKFIGN